MNSELKEILKATKDKLKIDSLLIDSFRVLSEAMLPDNQLSPDSPERKRRNDIANYLLDAEAAKIIFMVILMNTLINDLARNKQNENSEERRAIEEMKKYLGDIAKLAINPDTNAIELENCKDNLNKLSSAINSLLNDYINKITILDIEIAGLSNQLVAYQNKAKNVILSFIDPIKLQDNFKDFKINLSKLLPEIADKEIDKNKFIKIVQLMNDHLTLNDHTHNYDMDKIIDLALFQYAKEEFTQGKSDVLFDQNHPVIQEAKEQFKSCISNDDINEFKNILDHCKNLKQLKDKKISERDEYQEKAEKCRECLDKINSKVETLDDSKVNHSQKPFKKIISEAQNDYASCLAFCAGNTGSQKNYGKEVKSESRKVEPPNDFRPTLR